MLELRNHITRTSMRLEKDKLFVFGDNFERRGFGGQAKEMRGESNAVGIVTKHRPSMDEDAFLTDECYKVWLSINSYDICRLFFHKGVIVWPSAGIGTGLAQLSSRAPLIFEAIELLKERLK